MPNPKIKCNLFRCQWNAAGERCNAILTEDTVYRIFYYGNKLTVCGYHRKIKQSLELLDASYNPCVVTVSLDERPLPIKAGIESNRRGKNEKSK